MEFGTLKTIELDDGEEGTTVINVNLRESLMTNMSSFRDSTSSTLLSSSTMTIATRAGNFADHYELEKTLHQSKWSSVHLCRHKETHQSRIVKIVRETCSYCHEYEMLRQLDHPSLPVLYELFQLDQTHEFYMVMRRYEGESLQQSLRNNQMSEVDASQIFFQLLCCLNYLHHQQLVHCAIRPENIFLRFVQDHHHRYHGITLLDFTNSFPLLGSTKMNYIRGVYQDHDIVYLAPEILQEIPAYDEKCDIWACGVILYQLLSDTVPFVQNPDDTEDVIRQRILSGQVSFPDESWATVSLAAKDLVRHLLAPKSEQRITAAQALQHVWLAEQRKRILSVLDPSFHVEALKVMGNVRNYPTAVTLRQQQQHQQHQKQHQKQSEHPQQQLLDPRTTTDQHATTSSHAVYKLRQAIAIVMAARLLSEDDTYRNDRIFHAMDTNHNGQIDPKELRAGYYHAFRRMLPGFETVALFQQFRCHNNDSFQGDTTTTAAATTTSGSHPAAVATTTTASDDTDHHHDDHIIFHRHGTVLHYSEFKCAAVEESTLMTEENLQHMFDMLDKYSKKSIGVMELSDAFPYEYQSHLNMEDFITIVDQVDSTGKGGIVYEDFYRMMTFQPPISAKKTTRASLLMDPKIQIDPIKSG